MPPDGFVPLMHQIPDHWGGQLPQPHFAMPQGKKCLLVFHFVALSDTPDQEKYFHCLMDPISVEHSELGCLSVFPYSHKCNSVAKAKGEGHRSEVYKCEVQEWRVNV